MKISFIGAGKVGFSIGKYFTENNISVEGYYSQDIGSAIEASRFVQCKYFSSIEELVNNSDLIFITTNDDNIINVWRDLKHFNINGKIICHCSGSLSSDIFYDINNSGAYQYSIHPMYPFKDKLNSYKNLKSAYFSVEGHPQKLDFICGIFEKLGNTVLRISKEDKGRYHLANVMVSNLVLSLIELGVQTLTDCGVDKSLSKEALLPLIQSNIHNISTQSFKDAITGPVVRDDAETLVKHMQSIDSDYMELYKSLSLNLLDISKKKNPQKDYSKTKKVLGG